MEAEHTIPEAAAILGLPYLQVIRCVKRLGLGRRVSRLYVVTHSDLALIRDGVRATAGNPDWIANKKPD